MFTLFELFELVVLLPLVPVKSLTVLTIRLAHGIALVPLQVVSVHWQNTGLSLICLYTQLCRSESVLLCDVVSHQLEQVLMLDVESLRPRRLNSAISKRGVAEVDVGDAFVLDPTHA